MPSLRVTMGKLFLREPELYKGPPNRDADDLEMDIKRLYPNYKAKDPRTWPCIEHDNRTNLNAALSSVAYKKARMDFFLREVSYMKLNGTGAHNSRFLEVGWHFRWWPFNFDRHGVQRQVVGIPKADFEYWMKYVNGADWAKTIASASKDHSRSIDDKTQPDSMVTRCDKILEALDTVARSNDDHQSLQASLEQAQMSAAAERSRADKAEQELVATRQALKDILKEEQEGREQDKELSEHKLAAEKSARKDAEKKASEAMEQLDRIWDKVRSMQAVPAKRKADDDKVPGHEKRAKKG